MNVDAMHFCVYLGEEHIRFLKLYLNSTQYCITYFALSTRWKLLNNRMQMHFINHI